MSEITNLNFCPHCGIQLTEKTIFCTHCGGRLTAAPAPAADATQTGADESSAEPLITHSADEEPAAVPVSSPSDGLPAEPAEEVTESGATDALPEEEAEESDTAPEVAEQPGAPIAITAVRRQQTELGIAKIKATLLLILSVALLLCAFLPFGYTEIRYGSGAIRLRHSAEDVVELAVRSLADMTAREQKETAIYDDMLEAERSLRGYGASYALRKYPERVRELTQAQLRLALMGEGTHATLPLYVAAVAVLVYLIALLSLAIRSARLLYRAHRGDLSKALFAKAAHRLFSLLFCFPVLLFVLRHASRLGEYAPFERTGVHGLGAGAFLSPAILLIGAIVYLCAHLSMERRKTGRRFPPVSRRTILSAVAVLLLLVALFLPTVSLSFGDGATLSFGPLDHFYPEYEDMRQFSRDTKLVNFKELMAIAERLAKGHRLNGDDGELFYRQLVVGVGRIKLNPLYIAIYFVALFYLWLAGIVLTRMLMATFLGGEKPIRRPAILLSLLGIALPLLAITEIVLAAIGLPTSLSAILSFFIGGGTVLAPIAAVLLLIWTRRCDVRYMDTAYDNPDVSLTPYVLRIYE